MSELSEFLLELAQRNTESQRQAEKSSEHHWGLMESDKAMFWRGYARGLNRALNNQLGLVAEKEVARAAGRSRHQEGDDQDGRHDQDPSRAV